MSYIYSDSIRLQKDVHSLRSSFLPFSSLPYPTPHRQRACYAGYTLNNNNLGTLQRDLIIKRQRQRNSETNQNIVLKQQKRFLRSRLLGADNLLVLWCKRFYNRPWHVISGSITENYSRSDNKTENIRYLYRLVRCVTCAFREMTWLVAPYLEAL